MTWGKDTHGADTSQNVSLQNVVKIVPIAGIGGDGFLALREDSLAIKWGNGWYDTLRVPPRSMDLDFIQHMIQIIKALITY